MIDYVVSNDRFHYFANYTCKSAAVTEAGAVAMAAIANWTSSSSSVDTSMSLMDASRRDRLGHGDNLMDDE